MLKDGYSFLLPPGLLDYFTILLVEENEKELIIHLEEQNNLNTGQEKPLYESKGFYPSVLINDFPIRGKKLLLNIRRRRWLNKSTGEYISRDFHIIAEGTHITHEFASFLKGIHR